MKPISTRPRRYRRPPEPMDSLANFLFWFLLFSVFFGSWIAPGLFDSIFSFIGDLAETGRRLFF